MVTAQAEAQQRQQQLAEQLQMENQATVTRAVDAKAEADKSLAEERLNKIGLDAALNAERLARSEEERTSSALNILKAFKELESIDLTHIREKLALLRELEGKHKGDEDKNNAIVA